MQKESNILDPVQDTLDQDVFNGTVPKKEFFDYHLDHIREVFRQNGFNPYAFDFYLTGSLCTYQYSDKSDVDISIICNVNEFSEEDRSDLISIVIESLDGEFFPRTRHQYQHFVQPVGVDIEDLFILGMRSAWDFQKDKWVIKPRRAYAHNVQKEKPDWILAGVQVSDKINTLIDYHQYDQAKEMYKEIHRKRKEDQIEYGDYSEGNIIYKFLDNNGTFDRLKNIGQKISMKKIAFERFDTDYYLKDFIDSRLTNTPTHLNSRGTPCSCGFGSEKPLKVKNYYRNLLKTNSQFVSSLNSKIAAQFYAGDGVFEEEEIKEIKQNMQSILDEVINTQLNPESRWAKRYPLAYKEFVEYLKSNALILSDQNIKYLKGAINIFKSENEKTSDLDVFKSLATYNTGEGKRLKKAKHDFYEIFRTLSTNNYGKGFGNQDEQIESNAAELHKKYTEEDYLITDVINFIYILRDYPIESVIEDLKNNTLSSLFNEGQRSNEFINEVINILKEKVNKKENVFPLITTLFAFNTFLQIYSRRYYANDLENRKIEDFILDTIKNKIYKERPENILDSIISIFNPIITTNIGQFGQTMDLLRNSEIARITKEYRIPFPANINEIGNFNDVMQRTREILNMVREREEYKNLLRDFDITDYDDHDPVYEVEFKPGNPEKAMPGKWGVYTIRTTEDMELEGRLMDHCVGNEEYEPWNRRAQDLNTVYSVRDPNGIPHATIELDSSATEVGEARGRHNQSLTPIVKRILNGFFGQESFQRQSNDPTLYIIRQANGEEVQYHANSIEAALAQHKDLIRTTDEKEKAKEMKAVAGYGAGHNWFSVAEEIRTGTSWGNVLPAPDEDEEPYEVEESYYNYYDIEPMPEFGHDWENSYFWDWAQGLTNANRYLTMYNLIYGEDQDDMRVEDMPRDDYGRPYYYIVVGLRNFDNFENLTLASFMEVIDLTVQKYSSEEYSEQDYQQIESYLLDSVKAFGFALCLVVYDRSVATKTFDLIDFYIEKYLDSYKDFNKQVVSSLMMYRHLIKEMDENWNFGNGDFDEPYQVLDMINEIDFSNVKDIKIGSYNYSDYSNKYYRNSQDVEPQIPNKQDISELKNYYGYTNSDEVLNRITNEVIIDEENRKKILGFFKHALELLDIIELQINKKDFVYPSEEKNFDKKDVDENYVPPNMENIIDDYSELKANIKQVNYITRHLATFSSGGLGGLASNWGMLPELYAATPNSINLHYYFNNLKRRVKSLRNYVEFYMNQLYYNFNVKKPEGQISFYNMPPEPTSEEFATWELENKGKAWAAYKTPESIPGWVGYLND